MHIALHHIQLIFSREFYLCLGPQKSDTHVSFQRTVIPLLKLLSSDAVSGSIYASDVRQIFDVIHQCSEFEKHLFVTVSLIFKSPGWSVVGERRSQPPSTAEPSEAATTNVRVEEITFIDVPLR